MSQIHFSYEDFEVTTGWDRPLQMFFLTVKKKGMPEPVYDNLADPTLPMPGRMTLHQVIEKIDELGIQVPEVLARDLQRHCAGDYGNFAVVYK